MMICSWARWTWITLFISNLPGSRGTLSVRELLQQNRFREAALAAKATAPHFNPASQSDAALAEFLAGGSPAAALSLFVSLGYDLSLASDIRTAALRNAAHVDTVRDGREEKWANYDRSYEHYREVFLLHEQQMNHFINGVGNDVAFTPPHLIPLTQFDLDMGGRICSDPGLTPPETFQCGDKTELPAAAAKAGSATRSAAEAAAFRGSAGALGELYLDLVRRSLSNYLTASEISEEWTDVVLANTAQLASGPGTCEDAQGTACEYPFFLAYRAFGLSFNNFTKAFSKAPTTLSLGTLLHIQLAVERVLAGNIPGDLIEAGVFRGGATIFMRAVLTAHELSRASPATTASLRKVFVADSFAGIPSSRRAVADGLGEECDAWEERYAVSEQEVHTNFRRYGLDDDRTVFIKGFFNVSLPPIFGDSSSSPPPPPPLLLPSREAAAVPLLPAQQNDPQSTTLPTLAVPLPSLAVVRIDADAYDGVRDALESLYPRLSSGGLLIIDDWHLVAAAAAAHEYRRAHNVTSPIFLVPSDYIYSCSTGGQRVAASPTEKHGSAAAAASAYAGKAGSVAGLEGIESCEHPSTSLYMHNKHLVLYLLPQVAYWTKD